MLMYEVITKQLSGMAGRERKVTRWSKPKHKRKKIDLKGLRMIDLIFQ